MNAWRRRPARGPRGPIAPAAPPAARVRRPVASARARVALAARLAAAVAGWAPLAAALVSLAVPAPGLVAASPAPADRVVHRIVIDGVIAPGSARQIVRAIAEAGEAGAAALIIQLDTPGGLLKSTDEITKAILNAPLPVIVYIAPRGARAASAGVFITYAAHVAAMAPATHLGAATPVQVGGEEGQRPDPTMREKVTNDAVANIRAMALRRGRNADWAEAAVRRAVSITEDEAVRLHVVDLVAADLRDLLHRADGRRVETDRGPVTLRTAQARIEDRAMDITERFLSLLSDPNIGFILMNVGILGIMVELYNPGAVLPGVVGGIALILGLASFAILQVNVAGLLLIAFAVLLFIADIKVPGHGVLTVGGVAAFVFGAILLTEHTAPVLQISLRLILVTAALLAAFFLFAVASGVRAQRVPARSGVERLIGAVGVARSALAPEGTVYVAGELWSAVAEDGPIPDGARVRVVALEGLRLRVRAEAPPT